MTAREVEKMEVKLYELKEVLREVHGIAVDGYRGVHDEEDLRDILRSIAEHVQLKLPNDHD